MQGLWDFVPTIDQHQISPHRKSRMALREAAFQQFNEHTPLKACCILL